MTKFVSSICFVVASAIVVGVDGLTAARAKNIVQGQLTRAKNLVQSKKRANSKNPKAQSTFGDFVSDFVSHPWVHFERVQGGSGREIAVTPTSDMVAQLAKMAKRTVDHDGECPVCFESLQDKPAAILPCKHSLCDTCAKKWQHKGTCPLCRHEYLPQDAVNEFFKKAIEKQGRDSGAGKIKSVVMEGTTDYQPVTDDIDWTQVIKIKTARWKTIIESI